MLHEVKGSIKWSPFFNNYNSTCSICVNLGTMVILGKIESGLKMYFTPILEPFPIRNPNVFHSNIYAFTIYKDNDLFILLFIKMTHQHK